MHNPRIALPGPSLLTLSSAEGLLVTVCSGTIVVVLNQKCLSIGCLVGGKMSSVV